MRKLPVLIACLATTAVIAVSGARAQESVWLQVEAVRTLAEAEASVRTWSGNFANVAGFRLPNGFYAVALGPYDSESGAGELATLKNQQRIPSDSYIAGSEAYGPQFWPLGVIRDSGAEAVVPVQAPAAPEPAPEPEPAPAEAAPDTPAPSPAGAPAEPPATARPDETPQEARASEAQLDSDDRKLLQKALQWAGHYAAAIDGAFGAGTRNAMAAWQSANGHEVTGVLTTAQRGALMDAYRAEFAELGLETVRDETAGIEILLPAAKIARARTEAPFVHYDPTDGDNLRVLLISQTGDEKALFGLYEIMQTLEIVPLAGDRKVGNRNFVLTGQSDEVHSYTYAELDGDVIKGFSLAWNPADELTMAEVVPMIQASFTPIRDIVLPDTALSDEGETQRVDLLAGLELRRPDRSRTGFFVDRSGSVLTTIDLLEQCRRVTIGDEIDAAVAARDDALGLVLLKPGTDLAPMAVAAFNSGVPRLQTEIAVAGFSYGDVLALPVLTWGVVADIHGLEGEDGVDRLSVLALPGDAGGPVLNDAGAVLGMLRPHGTNGNRQFPDDVNFSSDAAAIKGFLADADILPLAAGTGEPLAPEDLATLAESLTVRVSCWKE
ncbi:serine protease [Tropicimonas sp.]|uniref:serine protease n=1 Tax=Tropicimonas sp. TaxID=2067044 RepID=UPI003A85AFAD